MEEKKLFIVFSISFIVILLLVFTIFQINNLVKTKEEVDKSPTAETQKEFERSFEFFVKNGPAPTTQEELNGMLLTYRVNGGNQQG